MTVRVTVGVTVRVTVRVTTATACLLEAARAMAWACLLAVTGGVTTATVCLRAGVGKTVLLQNTVAKTASM